MMAQRSQRGSDFVAGGILKIDMEALVSVSYKTEVIIL